MHIIVFDIAQDPVRWTAQRAKPASDYQLIRRFRLSRRRCRGSCLDFRLPTGTII